MRDLVNQWFEQSAPFQGILACGVRHPDRTTVCKTLADGYTEAGVENALRCVADVCQVMQVNRVPVGRHRWVFEQALFHCERRPDGACLGVFTPRETHDLDAEGMERFFSEFQAISPTSL
jgi:hypothetical protein